MLYVFCHLAIKVDWNRVSCHGTNKEYRIYVDILRQSLCQSDAFKVDWDRVSCRGTNKEYRIYVDILRQSLCHSNAIKIDWYRVSYHGTNKEYRIYVDNPGNLLRGGLTSSEYKHMGLRSGRSKTYFVKVCATLMPSKLIGIVSRAVAPGKEYRIYVDIFRQSLCHANAIKVDWDRVSYHGTRQRVPHLR